MQQCSQSLPPRLHGLHCRGKQLLLHQAVCGALSLRRYLDQALAQLCCSLPLRFNEAGILRLQLPNLQGGRAPGERNQCRWD